MTFRCWDSEDGSSDSAYEIEASDSESAAEAFADEHGWGDYMRVSVRDERGTVRRYMVDMAGARVTRRLSS